MGYFGRITSGLFSRVDDLVARVENHEGLAEAALTELQSATARGRARLARVQKDGEVLRTALAGQRQAATQWKERALRITGDEERALECLRRSRQAERKTAELDARLTAHDHAKNTLDRDVRALVERLDVLVEQRNVMRTRQTCAEALAGVQGGATQLGGELANIFERWEAHIAESEFAAGRSNNEVDPLKDDFDSEEEAASLMQELSALRGQHV